MQLRRREDVWSPMTRLRDSLNRFFDYPEFGGTDLFEGWQPAVDVHEDKDNIIVKAEMPGMKREDIDVSLNQNTLLLCGERKREEERKEEGYYRSERYFGKFQRSIPIPQTVDAQKIEARYRDGVLTVKLPKSEQSKAKQIDVKVD
jgi:HSP20 family protein